MKTYNYFEAVKEDVKNYIENDIDIKKALSEAGDIDSLKDNLSVSWLDSEPESFKRDFIIYDEDTLAIIATMHTTEAEARNYAMMHLININDRLEQIGLQKHKKAFVKACYIPNYNNIEFTMIYDL